MGSTLKMPSNILPFSIVFAIFVTLIKCDDQSSGNASLLSVISPNKDCLAFNQLMLEQSEACRCFDSPSFVVSSDSMVKDDSDQPDDASALGLPWIGCSKEKMPAIFKALTALPNETNLTQLWIWDSFMPMIPAKSFAKIRPTKLIIERCRTGDFSSPDVFSALGDRLTELELKNNVLRDITADLLAPLGRLVRLDLSVNQLTLITNATFGKALPALRVLSLYRNQLAEIADGALDNLQRLKSLNLANNRLTRITAATFAKLDRLEYLSLENNRINEIDEQAFLHLTRLRLLNLGGNRLKMLHFPAKMPFLKQLFLNNNSFENLDDIRMGHEDTTPVLETFYLDQNRLKTLASSRMNGGLKQWPTLKVLSLAFNELSVLKSSHFDGVHKLVTLSLTGNQLSQIDDETSGTGPFTKLSALTQLFLSQNNLVELKEGTFRGLSQLRILTVARNKLALVNENTFNGFKRLEKLFMNDNTLKVLHNNTFDVVQSTLTLIDLSDNPWQCDCKLLWLSKWIAAGEDALVVDSHQTKCAEKQQHHQTYGTWWASRPLAQIAPVLSDVCEYHAGRGQPGRNPYVWDGDSAASSNNVWITILGVVLGTVSIFILLAVSYLYFQEATKGRAGWRVGDSSGVTSGVFGRWTATGVVLRGEHALRRVPSDMVKLIPKGSTIASSAASTVGGEKM